jgi:hypothetical protein
MTGASLATTDDLARRVRSALSRAADAIALLDAPCAGLDLDALEAPPDKVLAETAIFLRSVAAIPPGVAADLAPRAHTLLRALIPIARSPRIALFVALQPALARDFAVAHTMLGASGYPDPTFARHLATATLAPAATGRERLPHRELEQHWLAALETERAFPLALLDRTALVQGVDLLTGSRDDVYAFTHALLYGGDFGLRRPWRPVGAQSMLALARSALAGALDDDDFDLAGELLLAWPLLDAPWDPCAAFGYSLLARVEDKVGLLPSLALSGAAYAAQPAETRQAYFTALSYHTAYVMGLLCAVLLTRDARPGLPPAAASDPFAERLLRQLAADERQPQWLHELRRIPAEQRGHYTELLLDIAVRRAVRRLDPARVRDLLQAAVSHNAPLSPLCAQAAGLLRRLAACPQLLQRQTADVYPRKAEATHPRPPVCRS